MNQTTTDLAWKLIRALFVEHKDDQAVAVYDILHPDLRGEIKVTTVSLDSVGEVPHIKKLPNGDGQPIHAYDMFGCCEKRDKSDLT